MTNNKDVAHLVERGPFKADVASSILAIFCIWLCNNNFQSLKVKAQSLKLFNIKYKSTAFKAIWKPSPMLKICESVSSRCHLLRFRQEATVKGFLYFRGET